MRNALIEYRLGQVRVPALSRLVKRVARPFGCWKNDVVEPPVAIVALS